MNTLSTFRILFEQVDGSLLVWVADFLDEYQPGAFRQAQVSFSSRIPNAIPIGKLVPGIYIATVAVAEERKIPQFDEERKIPQYEKS